MGSPFGPVGQFLHKALTTSDFRFDRLLDAGFGNRKEPDCATPDFLIDISLNLRRLVSSLQLSDGKQGAHPGEDSNLCRPVFASISLTDVKRPGKDFTKGDSLGSTANVEAANPPLPLVRQREHPTTHSLPDPSRRGPVVGVALANTAKAASEVPSPQLLPLWENDQGCSLRYVWNGNKLVAAAPHELEQLAERHKGAGTEGIAAAVSTWHPWVQIWHRSNERNVLASLFSSVYRVFVPDNVSESYWDYMKWKGVHKTSSSIQGVFATQSMLHAVGVGSAKQLPAAAALNWVLKDGLGRIGRLLVAGGWGKSFDYDLKRKRFMASVVYTASTALETLLPLCPQLFLPVATLANIGKSIGVTAHMATNPPILHSFVLSDNMGDVSAKGTAQHVIADNLGLGIAILLTNACRGDERKRMALAVGSFPVLAAIELYAMYREIKAVELKTLNKERAELIVEHWLARGHVLDPREVSQREPIFCPVRVADGFAPLRIGSIGSSVKTVDELCWLLATYKDDRYMLTFRPGRGGEGKGGPARRGVVASIGQILGGGASILPAVPGSSQAQLMLALREDARGLDVLQGLLQAAHLRHMLRTRGQEGEAKDPGKRDPPGPHASKGHPKPSIASPHVAGPVGQRAGHEHRLGSTTRCDPGSSCTLCGWKQQLLVESRVRAQRSISTLLDELAAQQWHTRNVMLSPKESVTYSLQPPHN